MENKKLEKKLQEWADVSSIYEVCWIVYQNGRDIYVVYSHSTELKHFVYDNDKIEELRMNYMYSQDDNRDKVIIKELNKAIKVIREHKAYIEYLEEELYSEYLKNCDCDE